MIMRNLMKFIYRETALAVLVAGAMFFTGCQEENSAVADRDSLSFDVRIETVGANDVTAAVAHNGTEDITYYAFCYRDFTMGETAAIENAVAALKESGAAPSEVLTSGSSASVKCTGLQSSTTYRLVVCGLDEDYNVYGTPTSVYFDTIEGTVIYELNPDWIVTYQGKQAATDNSGYGDAIQVTTYGTEDGYFAVVVPAADYEAKGITLNKRTFKKNLGLLTKDGKYNLMAQLLSDNSHIPVRFSLFSGESKSTTMYSVREFGNTCLLYSLDDVLRYGEVLNIPQADERNRIVERKEVPLFHAEAYREAVINAFVHNLWIDGNAPMFTGFRDRIEILSRGHLPPKQTVEGFFAGESVPVNQKLSDIFLQLHISERSGRGVPKITELYGKDCIELRENSIVVTIPFERLETKAYAPVGDENVPDRTEIPSVGTEIPLVETKIPPDGSENPLLKELGIEERILRFCAEAKNIQEIMEHLGYRDKKTVRKYLSPLLQQGRVSMTIPDKPNSKNQKYITII